MTDQSFPQTAETHGPPSGATPEMSLAMYQRQSALPRPEELQGYYDISPDVGERIMRMAENAADQRHRMQRRTMSFGLVFVFCVTIILLAVIAAAVWIAVEVTALGGVVLGVSPVTLIALSGLILRRRGRGTERSEAASTE